MRISIFDLERYARTGIPAHGMTAYDRLRAQALFGGGGTSTITGVPPVSFKSDGSALSDYSITGNMVQSGTPSPSSPIYPEETGDLVASGEHSGEYVIPITCAGTTQNIYLQEPIRKIGDYADVLSSSGTVTRRIAKLVLDGTENWSYASGAQKLPFGTFDLYLRELELISVCSHYTAVENKPSVSIQDHQLSFLVSGSGTNNLYIKDDTYADAAAFKAFLAEQYAAGTPVCIWYVLAAPAAETLTMPEIRTAKGNNTLSIGTTLQPSSVSITGNIKDG